MKITLLLFVFVVPKNEAIESWNINEQYNTYEEIASYLIDLSKNEGLKEKLKIRRIGQTAAGNIIPVIRFHLNYSEFENKQKPIILLDAGTHAREWITTAVAMYVIRELTEKENEYLLHNVDWFIIPLLNPDGYKYSSNNRLWRKNRSQGNRCIGVDLNRNWDYHWGEKGTSRDECNNNYQGRQPFSELETRALRDAINLLRDRIRLYVSLHSFGEYILYPWGYTNESVSKAFEKEHQSLGDKVAEVMNRVNGAEYIAGRQSDILYEASGISIDWAAGVAKIPLSYIIEVGSKKDRFTPSAKKISQTGKEFFEGLKVLHAHVEEKFIEEYIFERRARRAK